MITDYFRKCHDIAKATTAHNFTIFDTVITTFTSLLNYST